MNRALGLRLLPCIQARKEAIPCRLIVWSHNANGHVGSDDLAENIDAGKRPIHIFVRQECNPARVYPCLVVNTWIDDCHGVSVFLSRDQTVLARKQICLTDC